MIGYWMTLASSAGMIFSVELARLRIEHDLWDAEQPVKKFQFSIWSLLAWMTFVPLAIAYFQAIGPLIEWLFPSYFVATSSS